VKSVRVAVLVAAVAAGQVSSAMAGSLLQSANRLAQQAARDLPAPAALRGELRRSTSAQQSTPAESSMSGRKKFLIVFVALVGAAAGMYAIDRGVEDNTPSTKGTRKD
jgi:hypothetical protein